MTFNLTAEMRAAFADRYRIERELGAGGVATVFLAHDLKHDRDVAIKVMHPAFPSRRRRWRGFG